MTVTVTGELVDNSYTPDGANYRIQRATNSAFTQDLIEYTQGATLQRAFTDLQPSSTYYFRVAASNSAGYGPYSSTLTVTTVSGVYYSNGTSWLPAGVFVSDGTNWVPAELQVSNGTAWISAV